MYSETPHIHLVERRRVMEALEGSLPFKIVVMHEAEQVADT